MSLEIQNKLNIWKYKEYCCWYRIDKRVTLFFRKVKWMWQRAKYGYCDMDLWALDYTLGNYIASSINKFADITHTYPHGITPEEWDSILRSIARNFYLGVNEECWSNPYEDSLCYDRPYNKLSEDEQKVWDKFFKEEIANKRTMEIRRQEGFNELSKWFYELWD